MTRTPEPARGGVAGLLFVFCIAAFVAGLGFDVGARARFGFWIGAEPGAAGAFGVAAAVFGVIAARGARMLLARRREKGDSDASGHP